jgi:hypothetical protein
MSDTTEEYVEAMNEAARLKRKYEPDDGVIMDIMLQLTNDRGRGYMRVLVRTGEYLLLDPVL